MAAEATTFDRIFISYRREDNRDAGRIADSLVKHYGSDRVFFDRRDILPSRDFSVEILEQLQSCSVVLAVIGKHWHNQIAELHQEGDWVRQEIVAALGNTQVAVIPVLVDALLPDANALPAEMQGRTKRQSATLRHDDWDTTLSSLRAAEPKQRHAGDLGR